MQIPLTQGKISEIDDVDSDISEFKWCANKRQRGKNEIWYAVRGNPLTLMHRVVMERKLGRKLCLGEEVDHIDHDDLNNRRNNLRIASRRENCRNQRIQSQDKTSRYKGVCWHKRDLRWTARITIDGKRKYLGYFETEILAAMAYDREAKIVFGEFASLNVQPITKETA